MKRDVGSSPAKTQGLIAPEPQKRVDPKRIYAALVFVPLFYLFTRYLPPIFFFTLIVAVSLLAMWEFYGLHFVHEQRRQPALIGLSCGSLVLASLHWPDWVGFQPGLMVMLGALIAYQIGFTSPSSPSFSCSVILLFGVLYISFTLGHFLLIRKLPNGPLLIFFVLFVTWTGDAAAYYVGKRFGSHALAPLLSPKKTIEGLVGGLIAAPVGAWLASLWFVPILTGTDCVILGLALTLLGVSGDLSESAFKRQAGVKDSGSLIPGHGGVLDRIDSLLLSVPTFYYYMVFIKDSAAFP